MKRYLLLLPAAMLLSGCFFRSAEPAKHYDLPLAPAAEAVRSPLFFPEFANHTGAGERFLYKLPDGEVRRDAGHKWLLPPEELVPRALNQLNRPARPDDRAGEVNGLLFRFEADLGEQAFVLAGRFIFADSNQAYSLEAKAPLAADDPAAVVRAAAAVVAELNRQLHELQSRKH